MKNIKKGINLNIDAVNYAPIATLKQEDNASLELILYKDGGEFDITGQTVTLAAKRSDKVIIEQIDGFIINNNTLTINLKNNIIAKIGLVYLELIFTDEAGSMTTLDFYLKVNGKILGEDSLDASDNIASLEKVKQDFINSSEELLNTVTQNEDIRVQAEKTRKNNEETRNRSETSRANYETKRVEAEKTRVNQESLRVAAEEGRVAAERIRDEKVAEISSQCTKNTKEIDDAKGEYDTLKARLDRENEKVYETINDKDFLPFEGQNVTVEHSKVGFTKDIVVKGMTYQNLIDKKIIGKNCTLNDDIYTITGVENDWAILTLETKPYLKPNTTYTILVDIKEHTVGTGTFMLEGFYTNTYVSSKTITGTGLVKIIYTTKELGVTTLKIQARNNAGGMIKVSSNIMILEGEPEYIPSYFEGIKSAGEKEGKISILSTGKNLLPPFEEWLLSGNTKLTGKNEVTQIQTTIWEDRIESPFIRVVEGNYKLTCTGSLLDYKYQLQMRLYNFKKEQIGSVVYVNTTTLNFDSNVAYIKLSINSGGSLSGTFIFKDWQLEKDIQTPYCPYKVDKKEILLPYEYGHKGFIDGSKDMLEIRQDGLYAVQRLDKTILNGEQTITLDNSTNPNNVRYSIDIKNIKLSTNNFTVNNLICDKFATANFNTLYNNDVEGVCVRPDKASICVSIAKSKLTTQDVAGLKAWLQENPTTIYYELAKPIETKLDITSLNLETFKDITHVLSENAIAPNLSFKAPVDVPATISTLRARNESLEQENKELKEEVDMKTLKLHGQDVELTNSDLDLDFRIFELEMSVGVPMNLNMKGMRNMARSPFEMMKILVLNNNYDREDIEYKASRYLQGKRMTQVEYDEIISLMDANELVK